ncbi:MAG: PAS domain S-box protein [Spirochaetota bacterium]
MSKKILLVEDEALIAMVEAQLLKKHGYEVVPVYNGEKAVEAADNDSEISLVLMDIDLGKGMDGTEAAEKVLENHDLPIVFLSSHTEPEIVEKTEGITSYGYIVKNSGETVLLASLKMAFRLYDAHLELKRQKENLNTALIQYEQTAEELAEREALYRTLMENSIDGVELLDEKGNYLNVNQKECEMLGYSREELLNMKIADIDPNYPEEGFYRFWKEQPKGTSILFETLHKHKNGTLIPVEVNGIFFTVGDKRYIFGVARDIQARKRSENEIKAQEINLRTTLNSIGDAVISTDIDGKIVRMNPVAERLCGWSSDDAKGKVLTEVFHIVHAVTRKNARNPVNKVLETGNIIGLANHTVLISKEGAEYQIADSAAPIIDDAGHTTGVVLVFRDVTEGYEKERQLQESEKRYRSIVENINESLIIHDFNGIITFVNDKTCQMLNYTRDELIGTSVVGLHSYDHRNLIQKVIQKAEWPEGELYEIEALNKDGVIIPVEVSSTILSRDGAGEIQSVVRDISERKKTEELLLQKERQYRFIYNSLRDALMIVNANREIIDCNTAFTELFGYSLSEVQGKTTDILFASKDEYEQLGRMMQQQAEDSDFLYQPLYRTKTGEVFRGEKKIQYLKDENRKPMGFIGLIRDITERKRNEERLQKIIDNSPLLINEIDASGHYIMSNEATCKLLGRTKEELVGKHFEEVLPPEDASVFKKRIERVSETGIKMTVDDTFHIDRQEHVIRTVLFPIYRQGKSLPSIIGMGYEITKELRLLKEKDFLMQELNHRVKNNLNMISSLISLKDSETEADLSDLTHQIEAIGLIHEKLYQTDNVTEICCRDYFDDLLNSIFSSFTTRQVRIEKDIADVFVPTKTAMSLGLIINEIATNAIKYGFNEKEGAVFSLKMAQEKESNEYELTLSNTGNPFPDEIDIKNTNTLGLRLIYALVDQIDGALELQKKPNPVFTIRFPIREG